MNAAHPYILIVTVESAGLTSQFDAVIHNVHHAVNGIVVKLCQMMKCLIVCPCKMNSHAGHNLKSGTTSAHWMIFHTFSSFSMLHDQPWWLYTFPIFLDFVKPQGLSGTLMQLKRFCEEVDETVFYCIYRRRHWGKMGSTGKKCYFYHITLSVQIHYLIALCWHIS